VPTLTVLGLDSKMPKPKHSAQLYGSKKQKAKPTAPETVDEFQEAADVQEESGGKWRAGDPAKSGRAFVRALDIYDQGLQTHPASFDLAYNKARLELELTQQPALVSHLGLPLVDLLQQTLTSHRYAQRLDEQNPDVLFNTAQVLVSLAEQLSEADDTANAVPALQEALESLSACLARQEMLLEQQQAGFDDFEDGGVPLDPDEKSASTPTSDASEQTATVESPVTINDLLDTVHASLSALTTLVSLTDPSGLQTLGDMAQSLTESKAPAYISSLPAEDQGVATSVLALSRASFLAALTDAQYNALMVDLDTYVARLAAFDVLNADHDPNALCSQAEARTELSLSVLARFDPSRELPAEICWKQLSQAQALYSRAANLTPLSQIYLSRGDVEMLRHRLAHMPHTQLPSGVRKSAPTLAQNAQTYYKGAARLATNEEGELKLRAQQRTGIAVYTRALLYGVEPDKDSNSMLGSPKARASLRDALSESVEDGLLDVNLADELASRFGMGR